jgi:hypothetical protein
VFRRDDHPVGVIASLDRAFRGAIKSGDGVQIGRTAAREMWGDGWKEARSSYVLAEAVAGWLGKDAVQIQAFWNAQGQQHVVATVGEFAISGDGITTVDRALAELCRRYHSGPDVARLAPFDPETAGLRFTIGDVVAAQSISRLAAILTRSIDREVALVVLRPQA